MGSCFPHQLHTAVSVMIKNCTSENALDDTTGDFESPVEEPDNPHMQSLADALQRDPIAIARGIINIIRSSQLRRVEFKDIIEAGNQRQRWQNEEGRIYQIKGLNLIRDSPLRWGSTFLMIDRFLYLRLVSL